MKKMVKVALVVMALCLAGGAVAGPTVHNGVASHSSGGGGKGG